MDNHFNNAPPYTPTPEEIEVRAEEVRRGWSKSQELSRRVVKGSPYELTPMPERVFFPRPGADMGSI